MSTGNSSSGQTRCYAAKAPEVGPPLIQNGVIHLQAHQIGWIVSGVFAIIASIASFWLINKHIQWYTNKKEQRYIVRILFMVPIYASISFASYLFWNHSTPLVLIRDCYEAIVLTAFFYLLLNFVSPDIEEQKEVFVKAGLSRENDLKRQRRGEAPNKWVLPLRFVEWKPADGLHFLQLMKWGVLQYCVIRPTTTLVAVILNYVGLYCESSWSPGWGHIYITTTVSLSVTVAMYCLIQVYFTISEPLKPHRPLLKLFAIKAVVFLTFWQSAFLSMLSMFGVVKNTKYMTAENINIGIGAIAECVEMAIFAFLHIKCYTYKVYVPDPVIPGGDVPHQRTPRLQSLCHAMNFKETFRELWRGCVYMFRQAMGKETDKMIRRTVIMQTAFGRSRVAVQGVNKDLAYDEKLAVTTVNVEVEETVHVSEERQWLNFGHDYGYVLGHPIREKSDGLEEQIEKELTKRGYRMKDRTGRESSYHHNDAEQGHTHSRRSWWRSIYDRISQSGPDEKFTPSPKRKSMSRLNDKSPAGKSLLGDVYEDLPPSSRLRTYRTTLADGDNTEDLEKTPLEPDLGILARNNPSHDHNSVQAELSSNPALHSISQSGAAASVSLHERSDSLLSRVFPHGPKVPLLESGPLSADFDPSAPQVDQGNSRLTTERENAKIRDPSDVPEVVVPNLKVDIEVGRFSSRQAKKQGTSKRSRHVRDPTLLLAPLHPSSQRVLPDPVLATTTWSRHSPASASTRHSPAVVANPSVSSTNSLQRYKQSPHRNSPRLHMNRTRSTRDQITLPKPLAPASVNHDLSPSPEASGQQGARAYFQMSQPPRQSYSRSPRSDRRVSAPSLPSLPHISSSHRPGRSNAIRRSTQAPSHGWRRGSPKPVETLDPPTANTVDYSKYLHDYSQRPHAITP